MVLKKSLLLSFALCVIFGFAACAGSSGQSHPGTVANQNSNAATESSATSDAAGTNVGDVAGARLEQLNLLDGASPVIRSVALDGNRAGKSIDDGGRVINGRELSANNIRFIFELNEWISIRMDAAERSGISAVIVPHQDDFAAFTNSFADGIPENAPRVDLNTPENPDDSMASWGEMYLHVDYWKPGDYDLVFLSDNKPVARVHLKFYKEEELSHLSDAELEKLMKK